MHFDMYNFQLFSHLLVGSGPSPSIILCTRLTFIPVKSSRHHENYAFVDRNNLREVSRLQWGRDFFFLFSSGLQRKWRHKWTPTMMRGLTLAFSFCPQKSMVTCKYKSNRLGALLYFYWPLWSRLSLWKWMSSTVFISIFKLYFHFKKWKNGKLSSADIEF